MYSQDIEEIRASIFPESKLIQKGIIHELSDLERTNTNCYAYALGALCPAKNSSWYQPGFTAGLLYDSTSKQDFLEKLEIDLTNLEFNFREIKLSDVKLKHGEYIIQVSFMPADKAKDGDFHFVRRATKGGQWFHKQGWGSQPKLFYISDGFKVYDQKIKKSIINAQVAPFGFEDEYGHVIKPIRYYALSIKK